MTTQTGAPKQRILVIAGPTAGGKSAAAMGEAARQPSTIINADSMQVYKDLPILTAQPEAKDLDAAPHALYGFLAPHERLSAGQWAARARETIETALTDSRLPIIVGGTGLYIKALMEGLSPIPKVPKDIREQAVMMQQKLGNPGFHAALSQRDPEMAARIHPMHTSRLLRAWEVLEASGKSLAYWQKQKRDAPPASWHFDVRLIEPPREELYARCDARLIDMMARGALDEVAAFQARIENGEIPASTPLIKALGFRPLRDYLAGTLNKEEALAQAQAETRRYAKRQITWFRHQLK